MDSQFVPFRRFIRRLMFQLDHQAWTTKNTDVCFNTSVYLLGIHFVCIQRWNDFRIGFCSWILFCHCAGKFLKRRIRIFITYIRSWLNWKIAQIEKILQHQQFPKKNASCPIEWLFHLQISSFWHTLSFFILWGCNQIRFQIWVKKAKIKIIYFEVCLKISLSILFENLRIPDPLDWERFKHQNANPIISAHLSSLH